MEKFKLFSEQLIERYGGEEWFKPQTMHTMLASIKEKATLDSTKFSTKFLAIVETYGERQHNIESWLNRFPSMTSKDYANALDHIKQTISDNIEENKRLIAAQKAAMKARTEALINEGKSAHLAAKSTRSEMAAKLHSEKNEKK
jgi:predicted HTH transcriptional regulator